MPLTTFLLILVAGYVVFKLVGLTQSRGRLKFLGLTIAATIFLILQGFNFVSLFVSNATFTTTADFILEWGHITCLAFVLSSLAVFIRESKPVFAQFPMLYTGLPLLIVLSYFLVKDTYALKNWLIMIYQGGAITVSILMYSVYTYRRKQYALILIGSIIFLFSYLLYWYVPGIQPSYAWLWQLLLAAGLLTIVLGYEHTDTAVLTADS
ncbi:hypothetical protein [Fodinibius halophilus]|uniref:Uncharacterized protein n=1 Tax=Fodinibius halophilus TaxID=1736908 RepID=A0A6M1T6Y3_9BACT|nr:hypothetical protein [Fodinibius halophilus]NGP89075.1 hypothetical protein [Fodinibius halophilus]